jgi:hypothetical protein
LPVGGRCGVKQSVAGDEFFRQTVEKLEPSKNQYRPAFFAVLVGSNILLISLTVARSFLKKGLAFASTFRSARKRLLED